MIDLTIVDNVSPVSNGDPAENGTAGTLNLASRAGVTLVYAGSIPHPMPELVVDGIREPVYEKRIGPIGV